MAIEKFDTSSSQHYRWSRPGYLNTVVDMAEVAIGGQSPLRWLDVAAGTGALTALVASANHPVVALEADRDMAQTLRETLPNVPVVEGAAEGASDLIRQEFDVVSVAQALHYLDLERFVEQIRRLAPSGVLVVCSNVGDGEGWLGELSSEWLSLKGQPSRDPVKLSTDMVERHFGEPVSSRTEPNLVSYSTPRALAFIASLSSFRRESVELQARLLERARKLTPKHLSKQGTLDIGFLQTTTVYSVT